MLKDIMFNVFISVVPRGIFDTPVHISTAYLSETEGDPPWFPVQKI